MIRYPIKVLLVEDNPDQVLLTQRAFKRQNGDMQVISVERRGGLRRSAFPRAIFLLSLWTTVYLRWDGTDVIRRSGKPEHSFQ